MSAADEELWLAFQEEVGEQLDNLDMELLRGIGQCDIHQVFRDFHTIKSSCAMLDLTSMKELAHISEDYLDLLRKGTAVLGEEGLDALLASVETLKRHLVLAVATRSDPEPASSLMDTLRRLIASSATASVAAAVPASVGADPLAVPAAGPDPEYVELAESCARALRLLSAATALDAPLKNALIEMANMAELMDLPVIKALGRDIIKTLGSADAGAGSLRLLHDEVELLERLRLLETLHGVDCATHDAGRQWRTTLRTPFLKAVLELLTALERAGHAADNDTLGAECEHIAQLLDRLSACASLCGFIELNGLFRYVAQVVRSVRRGYLPASNAVLAALGRAVDHPYAFMLDEGEAPLVDSIHTAARQLEHSVAGGTGDDVVQPQAAPAVQERFRSGLDAAGQSLLGQMLNSGRSLYEIDLDMTKEEPVVEELLEWISQNGTILHNVSSFSHNGEADQIHIVFLVAFDQPLAVVRDALQAIDADNRYFRLREHMASDQAVAQPAADSHETPTASVAAEAARLTTGTIRIDSEVLDELVTGLGEIVMLRNMIGSLLSREKFDGLQKRLRLLLDKAQKGKATAADFADLKAGVLELQAYREQLCEADRRMQSSMGEVQQTVLDLREMPLSTVLNRLPNIARKQAQACGRKVELKMTGGDVRLDKGMIEPLLEPLVQLVCHAIEYGIEEPAMRQAAGKPVVGIVTVAASSANGLVEISVCDDGATVSGQALQARGNALGLARLRQLLGRIGGHLSLEAAADGGLRCRLAVPPSVAMQDMLVVRTARGLWAIPARNVAASLQLPPARLVSLAGQPAVEHQQERLPVVVLDELLSVATAPAQRAALPVDRAGNASVVVVSAGAGRLAVAVQQVEGSRSVFVPEAHPALATVQHVNGVTLLGDGSLVYILNTEYLLERQGRRLQQAMSA